MQIMEYHLENRKSFFYIFSIIGISSTYISSIVNFFMENSSMSIVEVIISSIALFNLYYFKKYDNFKLTSSILIFLMLILLTIVIVNGGVYNNGIYWIYTFPLLAFSLKGKREGVFWIVCLIISIFSLILLQKLSFLSLAYESIELIQTILVLIAISIMTYFYEKILFENNLEIQNKNRELKELNDTLKEKVIDEVEKNFQKDKILELQSRQAQMGEMISVIAHQWRQPLNAISVSISDFSLGFNMGDKITNEEIDDLEEIILTQINYMSTIIDEFRNFFKPTKLKKSFSIKQAINEILHLIGSQYIREEILIEISGDENIKLNGYKNEFEQVIINLLNNARDAMKERKISNKKIDIDISKLNSKAIVSIIDNAGGIPKKILDKIFEPYVSTKSEDKGTGIGLSMSKAIIEKIGGKIFVQNLKNGAKFTIEIPLCELVST